LRSFLSWDISYLEESCLSQLHVGGAYLLASAISAEIVLCSIKLYSLKKRIEFQLEFSLDLEESCAVDSVNPEI